MQLLPILLCALLTLLPPSTDAWRRRPETTKAETITYTKDDYKYTCQKQMIQPTKCSWDSDCKGIYAYAECEKRVCVKKCTWNPDCPRDYRNCNRGKCCNKWSGYSRHRDYKCI